MTDNTIFWIIIATAAGTHLARVSFFLLSGRMERLSTLRKALRFVPVAVLPAIIAPALFMPAGTLDVSPGNTRLVAGLVAVVVAWRTGNVLLTIASGMGLLWLLQALF